MVCGLFAAIFQGQSNNNHTVHQVYVYIIKVGHVQLPCAAHYLQVRGHMLRTTDYVENSFSLYHCMATICGNALLRACSCL